MSQTVVRGPNCSEGVPAALRLVVKNKFMLVCGTGFDALGLGRLLADAGIPYVRFSEFTPNPTKVDVLKAAELFARECCDTVLAVGGGSAIDVAKGILYYYRHSGGRGDVKLIAVPTTAGTGSESTRYAVIYHDGNKLSIADNALMPTIVFLDPTLLNTLPDYHKKCALLDALCQGIEAWWSINSTRESRSYSRLAVELLTANMSSYLYDGAVGAADKIMLAANFAGQAINIAATTAPHAMSYKLTSLYSLPHGHAVAMCLPKVWRHMIESKGRCVDSRGPSHLRVVLQHIAEAMNCRTANEAVDQFEAIILGLGLCQRIVDIEDKLEMLVGSVNPDRLKNHPVRLDDDDLRELYRNMAMSAV
ncbi:MAG: phosphonoacetaldehyde reductase [Thermaerobacter sp.]|nr:phosphonoacetaldehyde reductase [Thermaerobacter sp.]